VYEQREPQVPSLREEAVYEQREPKVPSVTSLLGVGLGFGGNNEVMESM
jgi:hypothetical protein